MNPIAFYSPRVGLEVLRHAGEQRVAKLLVTALQRAGFRVEIASELRTHDRRGDEAVQRRHADEGQAEMERISHLWRSRSVANRPALFITFSNHHSSPDYVGPMLTTTFGVPYVVIDASLADSERNGPWRAGYAAARDAIIRAHKVLALNRIQAAGLESIRRDAGAIVELPPFGDISGIRANLPARQEARRLLAQQYELDPDSTWLLTVRSMMREEAATSYPLMARVLDSMQQRDWNAIVIGDGPAHDEVRSLFVPMRDRVRIIGSQSSEFVKQALAASDIYLWPSTQLEFGMSLMDAQAVGLPVVAGRSELSAKIVNDPTTGRLILQGDTSSFARTLDHLIAKPREALDMGRRAREHSRSYVDIPALGRLLKDVLQPLIDQHQA